MKLRRIPILALTLVFLTGCYSQMHYSNAIHQDGFFWDPTSPSKKVAPDELVKNVASAKTLSPEFPLYYKNYNVAEWYARHGFGSHFADYYGIGNTTLLWDDYLSNPGYSISISSYHFIRPFKTTYNASSPLNFGPWVCWDPPYAFPGYYPPSITIFTGGGHGPLHHPGIAKGKSGSRTYGRRGIGTNRVKAGRGAEGQSGVLNTGRSPFPSSSTTGTIRKRETSRSGTIGTSTNSRARTRSTGGSSPAYFPRNRGRGN